jgi:hypothetical protein
MEPLVDRHIYNHWLALTNNGEDTPYYEVVSDNGEMTITLYVADHQEWFKIYANSEEDCFTMLDLAKAICASGDIISHLQRQIFGLKNHIEYLKGCELNQKIEKLLIQFMNAWVWPLPRSLHQLRLDMDAAYNQAAEYFGTEKIREFMQPEKGKTNE